MTEENKLPKQKKAAALAFTPNVDVAPRVLATGKGLIADRIMQVAKDNGIPLYEDASMVEILVKLDLGDYIPFEIFQAVAEVLAFIYTIEERAKRGRF